jgi:hypothetical protein|nr:MAG TPA: hypothetical protein [Caudoviricetes sp.]
MAKIDVTQIAGYETMSAEEKLKALEAYDVPDPDYSGYVKKDVFDKTASELAAKKKELLEKMSEDEAAKQKDKEDKEAMQKELDALRRESTVSKTKAKLIALGYDEALAEDTAEAMADGKMDKVFANQQKHLTAFEKKVRADALKDTPKPTPDGDSKTMTLDKLRKMSPQERYEFSVAHPEEYKSLYGEGGN